MTWQVPAHKIAGWVEDVVAGEIGVERLHQGKASPQRARDRILRQFGLGLYVDHSAEYQDHIVTVTLEPPPKPECEHRWEPILESTLTEWCLECGETRIRV